MTTYSSLFMLAALGALTSALGTSAAAAVDTSQWKCESCPFDKAETAVAVQVGVGGVSDASNHFGSYTGLKRRDGFLVLGGDAQHRSDSGFYGSFSAADLGLDSRSFNGEVGKEGLYRFRIGYSEIPRWVTETAMTPFSGVGGSALTLPGTFVVAPTTAGMPLATTLHPVDVGSKRSRLDLGLSWVFGPEWSASASVRHDVRDGTQRMSGSFFSTATQLAVPVDQVTDQFEATVSYAGRNLRASLGYQASLFRNGSESLTWSNPFSPIVSATSVTGQLALAPSNEFHQVLGSASYEFLPWLRASGDIAVGRMTQDADFLAPTANAALAALLPAMPATSLNGSVDTFNGSIRVQATPWDRIRINGSYARDVRDNHTARLSFVGVTTDMIVSSTLRTSQPYSFTQDRVKLSADYRGPGGLKASAGVDQNDLNRTLQEVDTTHETTVWGRLAVQPRKDIALLFKAAHAERGRANYGVASWIDPAENPLMRKFNMADRRRDSGGVRADFAIGETVTAGLNFDYANDNYFRSTVGLTGADSASVGGDVAVALSEQTQLVAYVQSERIRSQQSGSQASSVADWSARSRDTSNVVGIGVKHSAMKGQLDLGADLALSRSRSAMTVETGAAGSPFPTASTSLDSLKVYATYRLAKNMTLTGTLWYQSLRTRDWHLDGVAAAAVPNLLSFGDQAPHYDITAMMLAMRYSF